MEVITQNFDAPAIDWTKANILFSTRLAVLVLNAPTPELGESVTATVLQDLSGLEKPEEEKYLQGEVFNDWDPDAFELFNGQVLLKNS